jgi:putative toxin-antitoxin system antitoxin component (TIGR02293 family)
MSSKKQKSKNPGAGSYKTKEISSEVSEPFVAYAPAMTRTVQYLGGRASGLAAIKEDQDFIDLIKKGLPRKSLDHLMINTGLNPAEIASIMHTSDRTLRRYKPSKLLNPEQSERVIELARLYSRGEEVFGGLDTFKEWMGSPVLALGNRRPKEFLDTSMGIEMLMDELGRIEQGVFA